MPANGNEKGFHVFATQAANGVGTNWAFLLALLVIVLQNTQNRDARAIHLKLDEIIKSIDQAHNEMIDIEHLSDAELQKLADKYQKVREACNSRNIRRKRERLRRAFLPGSGDTYFGILKENDALAYVAMKPWMVKTVLAAALAIGICSVLQISIRQTEGEISRKVLNRVVPNYPEFARHAH